jgi:hypothetical protein
MMRGSNANHLQSCAIVIYSQVFILITDTIITPPTEIFKNGALG